MSGYTTSLPKNLAFKQDLNPQLPNTSWSVVEKIIRAIKKIIQMNI